MRKENDFWLIDSNSVGVIRFYENNKNKDDLIKYMIIEYKNLDLNYYFILNK